MIRLIVTGFALFISQAALSYPTIDQCPKDLEGKWRCVSKPLDPRWKDAWPDYDEVITSEVSNGVVVSYTSNSQVYSLDQVPRKAFVQDQFQYWTWSWCEEQSWVICMSATHVQTGERIGGMACEVTKLDSPGKYTVDVSGGNATYTCEKLN